jgi:SAM-dependent methyltransferase
VTEAPQIDATVPNSARIWNYWLGGKDNYPVDREAGDDYRAIYPEIVEVARASRRFLTRAVRYLAGEAGLRQFLDIGTGLPTAENTHEVAQRIAADARVVYVDNDPVVLAHARALLTSTQGVTAYVDADLHDPDAILEHAGKILDFGKPVALMLMGILGHIQDYEEAKDIVRRLQAALPPGSYFVHYDSTDTDAELKRAQEGYDDTGAVPYVLRSPRQLTAYYEGLELLEPGIVSCPLWRPEPGSTPEPTDVYGGVAYKP